MESNMKTDKQKLDEIHEFTESLEQGVRAGLIWAITLLAVLFVLGVVSGVRAEERTIYNDRGQQQGTITTGRDGVSTFRNDRGQQTGTARTGRDGVTTFENSLGQQTGTVRGSGGRR